MATSKKKTTSRKKSAAVSRIARATNAQVLRGLLRSRWDYVVEARRAGNAKQIIAANPDGYREVLEQLSTLAPADHSESAITSPTRDNSHNSAAGVEVFVGHLIIHDLIEALTAHETVACNDEQTINNIAGSWLAELLETLITYYDAAILEVLAERGLHGALAISSYNKSVLAVHAFRNGSGSDKSPLPPGHTQARFLGWFSQHLATFSDAADAAPDSAADNGNENSTNPALVLEDLLADFERIAASAAVLELNSTNLTKWFAALGCAAAGLRAEPHDWGIELIDTLTSFDESRAAWLLWPKRLIEITTGAKALAALDDTNAASVNTSAGYHWRRIDLGSAEFSAAATLRTPPTPARDNTTPGNDSGPSEVEKTIWLEQRLRWLWWQTLALYVGAGQTVSEAFKRGLARRGFQFQDLEHRDPSQQLTPATSIECLITNNAVELNPDGEVTNPLGDRAAPEFDDGSGDVRVVVFGAGIAGLSAAHELASRGFAVTVVEKQPAGRSRREQGVQVGGIARTQWDGICAFPQPGHSGPLRHPGVQELPVPGEHGYRFFPSFYRHLFDTMKRTPLPDPHGCPPAPPYATAFDQLQPAFQQVFARREAFVPLSRTRPRSFEAFRKEYMKLIDGLGFSKRDIAHFFFKLVRYLMTCSDRRSAEYEDLSMLDYFGGPELYSAAMLDAMRAAPQALVAMDAMDAEYGDARTQLNVYLQLLMDQILGGHYTDNTLRGPTSESWFEYWRDYLGRMGVQFAQGTLLSVRNTERTQLEIIYERPAGEWRAAGIHPVNCGDNTGTPVPAGEPVRLDATYYVLALDAIEAERVTSRWNSGGVPADLRRFGSYVEREVPAKLHRYEVAMHASNGGVDRTEADDQLRWLLTRLENVVAADDQTSSTTRSALAALKRATGEVRMAGERAEDIRVTLWMQQRVRQGLLREIELSMSQWLRGTSFEQPRFVSDEPEWSQDETRESTPRVPGGSYGDSPYDRFQTFTGVQYYFAHDFRLVRGYMYFPDTEWGLSVVSQRQFWADQICAVDGTALRGILSVDIGDCRKRSSYTGKSLMETANEEEIAIEVWRQVQDSLQTVRGETAPVTHLPLPQPRYFHVDENLEFDGKALRNNLTPFLVNNVGDWQNRPRCTPWVPGTRELLSPERSDVTDVWQAPHGGYRVHNSSVVFCGHYMRTFTRMTTMEAANESARHAVNAILDHYSRSVANRTNHHQPIAGDYCDIWDIEQHELEDFDFFKRIDQMLFERGKPHIADILRFDDFADIVHPESTHLQALVSALGTTGAADMGIGSDDIVAAANTLMEGAKSISGALGEGGAKMDYKIPDSVLNALRGRWPGL